MSESEPVSCPVCNMPVVQGCQNASKGGGIIPVVQEDGTTVATTCPNFQKLRLRRHLAEIDPQLVKPGMVHDRHSPLFQPATEKRKKVDATKKNLFIKGTAWLNFLPHLKWVAGYKGTSWFCRVTSDRTLLNIFVGNTHIKARQGSGDEDLLVVNSIEDYVKNPDLLIIRLGTLLYTNKAAAGMFAETLRYRASVDKPTWIVEPDDVSFTPFVRNEFGGQSGMPVCNEVTLGFVHENFQVIKLRTSVTVEVEESGDFYEDEDGNVVIGEDVLEEEGAALEGLEDPVEASGVEDEDEAPVRPVKRPRKTAAAPPEPEPEQDTENVDDLFQEKKKRYKKGGTW